MVGKYMGKNTNLYNYTRKSINRKTWKSKHVQKKHKKSENHKQYNHTRGEKMTKKNITNRCE